MGSTCQSPIGRTPNLLISGGEFVFAVGLETAAPRGNGPANSSDPARRETTSFFISYAQFFHNSKRAAGLRRSTRSLLAQAAPRAPGKRPKEISAPVPHGASAPELVTRAPRGESCGR